LAATIQHQGLASPAILVIGEVVKLAAVDELVQGLPPPPQQQISRA
jgi:siroheme synthase